MRLTDTERGQAWLDNFAVEHRNIAASLLDAFVLAGWTDARRRLLALLREVLAEHAADGPAWVLPVMDSGDIAKVADLDFWEKPTALYNFSPAAPIPVLPGSEALVGHLIRDVQGVGVLPPTTELHELERARIRTVILVTDLSESGAQVEYFANTLTRNRTLRSWRSFGWIRIVLVAYAVSMEAERRLGDTSSLDELRYVTRAPSIGSLPWTRREVAVATNICRRYGTGRTPLGYASHGGLFGFQDRVPNTVPTIFRQRGRNWTPLFEGRLVPPDLAMELDLVVGPTSTGQELLGTLKQERLRSALGKQQHPGNRLVITALAGLLAPQRARDVLEGSLGLTQAEAASLLNYLRNQNWLAPDGTITESGRAELVEAKKKPRHVETDIPAPDPANYYPESLR